MTRRHGLVFSVVSGALLGTAIALGSTNPFAAVVLGAVASVGLYELYKAPPTC